MSYYLAIAAQNAILDGGLPGLITLGGGSLQVALFLDGVECSGNGYARQTVASAAAAAAGEKDLLDVTFSASGGTITYNQVKVYAADGTTLYMTSGVSSDQTIGAEAHRMTLTLRTLDSSPVICANAAEVQTALNAQQVSKLPVKLAPVDIPVTSSLTWDGYFGPGVMYGEGAIEAADDEFNMLLSVLRWAGARGVSDVEPLLIYELGRSRLEDIAFRGATVAQIGAASVARAPIGLLFRWASGFGTGKMLGSNLYFSYFRKAIKLAENLADGNCDECSWRDCQFDRNDIAVELSAYQTLGHHFHHPRFGDNTICFNIIAGGDLSITNGLMAGRGNYLFNFPEGSAANFGGNNNSYSVNKLKVDSQATGCRIVNQFPETGAAYFSNIELKGVHFPTPQAANGDAWEYWGGPSTLAPAIVASGNTTISLENAIGIGRGMIQHQTGVQGVTRIRVINADINRGTVDPITAVQDLVDDSASTGLAHYTFEGCHYNGQQGYFPDWSGTI